tara:strand:- start:5349 stop:6044 length:696 start_codon:yes stop_codon:yes gene_type:complete
MYDFLFNQTYMSIFVIALLVFLIMFLWRKLTILEGNFFLLEKRVNIIKKEERVDQISKNLERSDAIMKEVFKNNIKRSSCNSDDGVCPIPTDCGEEDNVIDDIETNIDITIINFEEENPIKVVQETKQYVNIEVVGSEEDELVSHIENITSDIDDSDKKNIVEYTDNSIEETASTTSDITFNNEDDKTLSRKYKAMNLEKLREECTNYSLNIEGTKSILISRIIDYIKKQK